MDAIKTGYDDDDEKLLFCFVKEEVKMWNFLETEGRDKEIDDDGFWERIVLEILEKIELQLMRWWLGDWECMTSAAAEDAAAFLGTQNWLPIGMD